MPQSERNRDSTASGILASGNSAFKVTLLDPAVDYQRMQWKNGLGVTDEIMIDPYQADFRTQPFNWRLSSARLDSSCSFSIFPQCINTLVLLPSVQNSDRSGEVQKQAPLLKIRHNNEAKYHSIKPLMPYTWDAKLTTECQINLPCQDLTLMVNRLKVQADVVVETVDSETTFCKLLLAPTTLVYCVQGPLQFTVDSQAASSPMELKQHQTLVIERGEGAAPKYLRINSAKHINDPIFIFIQINELAKSKLSLEDLSISKQVISETTPAKSTENAPRKGSVLVYDDQPMWELPQEFLPSGRHEISLATTEAMTTMPLQPPETIREHQVQQQQQTAPWADLTPSSIIQSPRFDFNQQKSSHGFQVYEPPEWLDGYADQMLPAPPVICDALNLEDFPLGKISTAWIQMIKEGLSEWIKVPCIIARGSVTELIAGDEANGCSDGTTTNNNSSSSNKHIVVGITAALHGNEVNGVSCIQRLMADLDISRLNGTVVAVPCVNIPGYLNFKREFSDGKDLNRLFPGSPDGTASQIYAHTFMTKIVNNFNYLIDLHTASFGRVNSYYVRADMNDPITSKMGRLQYPQIILHNSGQDGTLRSAAAQKGIKSITVEIGNPQQFQDQFIHWSYKGLLNILDHLGMYTRPISGSGLLKQPVRTNIVSSKDTANNGNMNSLSGKQDQSKPPLKTIELIQGSPVLGPQVSSMGSHGSLVLPPSLSLSALLTPVERNRPYRTVVCSKGFWTYTRTGGVMEVYPVVNSFVRKGQLVARIKNIFGTIIDEYHAPCDAMIIGRSSNPVAMAGDRIIHFGVPLKKGEILPAVAKENY